MLERGGSIFLRCLEPTTDGKHEKYTRSILVAISSVRSRKFRIEKRKKKKGKKTKSYNKGGKARGKGGMGATFNASARHDRTRGMHQRSSTGQLLHLGISGAFCRRSLNSLVFPQSTVTRSALVLVIVSVAYIRCSLFIGSKSRLDTWHILRHPSSPKLTLPDDHIWRASGKITTTQESTYLRGPARREQHQVFFPCVHVHLVCPLSTPRLLSGRGIVQFNAFFFIK